MRATFLSSLAVLLVLGCSHVSPSTRSAGRVVFPPNSMTPWGVTTVWLPSEADIVACEVALGKTLAKHGKDLARYNVRLCGADRFGGRVIVGDACHIGMPGAASYLAPPTEHGVALATFGGGEAFFSFQYDAIAQKLTDFQFNAPL